VEILVNSCRGYNKTYAFYGFLDYISLKIKAKTAKMHMLNSKTYAS
jgi:hypothetical protein